MWPWLAKLAVHGSGIAITFARTETKGFQREVWGKASALLFLYGRPHFYRDGKRAKGNSGGPVVLIGYGAEGRNRLWKSQHPTKLLLGALVTEWER